MGPAGNFSYSLGWPRLVGPYIISALTLALAVVLIQVFLRPDPYLLSQKKLSDEERSSQASIKPALAYIRKNERALFAIMTIAIGHVVMVSVMVMTPVHMAHVDVSLTIIGIVISIHVLGMYAFSPIVGQLSDKIGRIKSIQLGIAILLLSTLVSGFAAPEDTLALGVGLFLLGLGWSFTLIAGSTLLAESVNLSMKSSSQGASDLVMNLSGAGGGVIAGVIIGTLNYGWLCAIAAIPVIYLGYRSFILDKLDKLDKSGVK
jgi:MFS family permease